MTHIPFTFMFHVHESLPYCRPVPDPFSTQNGPPDPVEKRISRLYQGTLSNVTLERESKRPLWKCGTTDGGSLPRLRISSSVGSLTK